MTPVAGVDGGGTTTRVLVLDAAGRVLGRAEGGAGRVAAGDAAGAADVVHDVVRVAAATAGVDLPLRSLWCGLAGAGRPGPREAVRDLLGARNLAGTVSVGTDVDAALRDAFCRDEAGILLICGTGSIAVGTRPEGRRVRAGGWGPVLGDEGSGYWIGVAGLRAVVRARDGRGPDTTLHPRLLAAVGVDDVQALVPWSAKADRGAVAGLAPEIVRTAATGDAVATALLEEAVRELVAQVRSVADRLEMPEGSGVALAGGLIGGGRPLRDPVEAALRRAGFDILDREVRGERGAARLALEATGRPERDP